MRIRSKTKTEVHADSYVPEAVDGGAAAGPCGVGRVGYEVVKER